jgi:hypothetical protein
LQLNQANAELGKKRAGREALLVALCVSLSSIVIVVLNEVAANIAPRTCFPPKT